MTNLGLRSKYRVALLTNTVGKDVLSDILTMCHFGETLDPENKVQVSEYNVGVAILHKCGVFEQGTKEQVIRALANVVPESKEGE